jgi:hypothetical protein
MREERRVLRRIFGSYEDEEEDKTCAHQGRFKTISLHDFLYNCVSSGLITRQEAESLLQDKPMGSFLVRISERIWGYAISYRDADRCKHYLVDASNGHYQFLGANQIMHNTLGELLQG